MSNPTGGRLKFCHAALLGTTALVCLSVVEPVFAEDFIINGDQTTTNGQYPSNAFNGNDSVTLNGTITTTTDLAPGYGISTTGGSNKISIETGSISTQGEIAYGIYNKGKSNETTIESGGSIETTGIGAIGVFNEGSGNTTTVEVEGSILTTGDNKANSYDKSTQTDGIRNSGDNNTTNVSGTVTTRGNSARGIYNAGGSNTTTLSGSIITEGKNARGIVNNRANNETTITETGSIETAGTGSTGIRQSYDAEALTENILTVEGSISTKGKNARGISNETNGNKTTVSGSISTQGETAYGIYNFGDSNTTTISAGGTVTTTGPSSHGVFNEGNTNTTTVSGDIDTTGEKANGVYNKGSGNVTTIEAGGSITAQSAQGVRNTGSGNTTNVAGSISTKGDRWQEDGKWYYSDGIFNTASSTTDVSGTITVEGNSARGIHNSGGNHKTTVSGSIYTTGNGSHGIALFGNTNINNVTTITETGTIKTTGNGSSGIIQVPAQDKEALMNTQITVDGRISTEGRNALGIKNQAHGNITTVSGSISTQGETAYGIYNSGNSNKTDVAGSITTQGETAYGIYNLGDSNTTTVSGSIITGSDVTTSSKHGIYNLGDNNITILAPGGSITTTGVNTGGIFQAGDNNTAGVFGTVNSSGTGSAALYNASGTGNTFVLNETAVIIGSISAGNAASNNTLALSEDADFELTIGGAPNEGELGQGTGPGQWTLTVVDEQGLRASTQSSDRQKVEFVAVDVSNCAAGSTICYEAVYEEPEAEDQIDEIANIDNGALIDSLSPGGSGGGSSTSGGAGSDKSSGAGAKGNVQTRSNTVWANVYGIKTTGDETDTRAEMKSRTAGFTIGVPVRTNNDLEWDVVFNLSNSRNDLGSTGDQELKVQSYNFGAIFYDLVPSSNWTVDAFGFIGYNDYDQERDVRDNTEADGIDTRKYSYSGNEILLGFDAQYYKPFNETLDLKFGVNGFLSHEKISSYSTGEYYKWDARNMTQGSVGISTGVEHRKGALMAYADIGVDYVTLLSGKTADYSFNGQSRSFTASDTDDVYGKVNVGFEYNQSENMLFRGDFSGFSSTGGITGYAASLGIEVNF